jgi:hypothetical protein
VHEDVFTILSADEAIALGIVKPLYCSLFHVDLVCSSSEFTLEGVGELAQVTSFSGRELLNRFCLTYVRIVPRNAGDSKYCRHAVSALLATPRVTATVGACSLRSFSIRVLAGYRVVWKL